MEALFKVDSTISFFPFGLPQSSKCDILKMGSTLGKSLSQLSSYFDGLHLARDAYPHFLSPSSWDLTLRMIYLSPIARPNSMALGRASPFAPSNAQGSLLLAGSLAPMVTWTQPTCPRLSMKP